MQVPILYDLSSRRPHEGDPLETKGGRKCLTETLNGSASVKHTATPFSYSTYQKNHPIRIVDSLEANLPLAGDVSVQHVGCPQPRDRSPVGKATLPRQVRSVTFLTDSCKYLKRAPSEDAGEGRGAVPGDTPAVRGRHGHAPSEGARLKRDLVCSFGVKGVADSALRLCFCVPGKEHARRTSLEVRLRFEFDIIMHQVHDRDWGQSDIMRFGVKSFLERPQLGQVSYLVSRKYPGRL